MSIHRANRPSHDAKGRTWRHVHIGQVGRGRAYISDRGEEDKDGSVRLLEHGDGARLEKRKLGVWNGSVLELGAASVLLGHDLALSAIGENLQLTSVDGRKRFLVPRIEILDAGTTHPEVLVVDVRIPRLIFQPDDSVDRLATSHIREFIVGSEGLGIAMYFSIGAVAASKFVQITINLDQSPTGPVAFERKYPASEFPSNTEVRIETEPGIAFNVGDTPLLTLSSEMAFSMKGTATSQIFLGVDFQPAAREDLVVENTLLINREADLLLNREGDFVITRSF